MAEPVDPPEVRRHVIVRVTSQGRPSFPRIAWAVLSSRWWPAWVGARCVRLPRVHETSEPRNPYRSWLPLGLIPTTRLITILNKSGPLPSRLSIEGQWIVDDRCYN